jgi:CBS domain-containing protein
MDEAAASYGASGPSGPCGECYPALTDQRPYCQHQRETPLSTTAIGPLGGIMKAIYTDARDPSNGAASAARRRVTVVMSSPVQCVPVSTTLGAALELMVRSGVRHLALVDGTGRFSGILSDRAIAAAWAADPSCLARVAVSTMIESGPATVGPGAHVLDAARAMRSIGADAVAVIDATGAVLGIVTGSDLIAQLAR